MSKVTIYEQACKQVIGFEKIGEEFMRKLVIANKSRSTHENYLRQMSKLAIYYQRTPLELSISELEEYLFHLIQQGTDSLSAFKHLVYGLRKLYELFGEEELGLALPSIKKSQALPVVLSNQEVKRILQSMDRIADKVMFGLIYDTGLRITELTNLLIGDIDLDRGQVHVRKSKNKKDRYITMSGIAVRGIKKHLTLNNPQSYVFESPTRKGIPISVTQIRRLLKKAVEKCDIKKQICVHTLRHTYATHQLEAGQNIMTVKDSMGHCDIRTTLVYLHIAQLNTVNKFGCLETLYQKNSG